MAANNQLRRINDDHSTEHNMEHEEEKHSTPRLLSFKSNHKNRRHPQHHLYWPLSWIIFMVSLSSVSSEMIYRVDPLALLAGTLRTYQKAGCDAEYIALSCPRGTSISIEIAQYGNTLKDGPVSNMCPPRTDQTKVDTTRTDDTEIEVKPPETCLTYQLQYALLQIVVEACQKKRHCKFLASSRTMNNDPCPETTKFIEIAYKCRPYEFRSKVACENETINLMCNPYSRIAVYSASFGRTSYESIQCSQPQGVMEESCLASYGTETVMQLCHGRRRCTISADRANFGNPCRPESRVYLKVVYTCIPRKVLKDQFDASIEPDEPQQIDMDQDQDDLYDEDQFFRESEAIPPAPKLHRELATSDMPTSLSEPSSSVNPPLRSRDSNQLEENQEKFFLYLFISVTVGVLLCLTLVIGRLVLQKRQVKSDKKSSPKNQSQNGNNGETTIPNGFSDDISEIDGDIDMKTTTLPVPSVSRNEPNYGSYAPSPSPYGNLGPSNISHTSTTMLVPTSSILSTGHHVPSIIGSANPLMYPPPSVTQMGSRFGTNYPPPPTVGFMNPSILAAGGTLGTLRRPRVEYDSVPPRILSKIDIEPQFYYG
ncbi:protein eva-1 [Sitodiplosis mosellana]|uniref:protein eva-1 n=1 Tax=Sitodiplosis mosellana TaxID=263140 RepID=UPI002444149C|nr:protein eva-1 [Sitodiplosis mosellana]XP_055306904.1 protein eva-1 [Sitodiplosis mosellana]